MMMTPFAQLGGMEKVSRAKYIKVWGSLSSAAKNVAAVAGLPPPTDIKADTKSIMENAAKRSKTLEGLSRGGLSRRKSVWVTKPSTRTQYLREERKPNKFLDGFSTLSSYTIPASKVESNILTVGNATRPFINSRWWSRAGGVDSVDGAYEPANNTITVISELLPGRRADRLLDGHAIRSSGHEGVLAHERGHEWQYNNLRVAKTLNRLVTERLQGTFRGEIGSDVTPRELGGHFRATLGSGFGNRAALKLPLLNVERLEPSALELWSKQIPGFVTMSPTLQNRLLSARAHVFSNYNKDITTKA